MEALLDSIEHIQIHSTTCFIVPNKANTPPEEIWKVDGATPIYQFIKGLSLSFALEWDLVLSCTFTMKAYAIIKNYIKQTLLIALRACFSVFSLPVFDLNINVNSVSVCTSNLTYQKALPNGFSWESYWRKATKDVNDVRFRKAVGGKCIIQLEPGLGGYARTVR